MKPIFLGALLALVACRTATAPDLPKVTAEPPPSAPHDIAAKQPSPAEATPAGWTAGTPAKGTSNALTPSPPVGVLVPAFIAERVTGPSLLFFYSPTCPHCQAVMPEINHLRETLPDLIVLGIPTGSATPRQIDQFVKTYAADFEMVVDENRAFAQAVGARSTPTVYIARPTRSGETPVNAA